jgi:hypothetical protein
MVIEDALSGAAAVGIRAGGALAGQWLAKVQPAGMSGAQLLAGIVQ